MLFRSVLDCEPPLRVLAAHNLKPSEWKVVLFTSNVWQSQVKGGQKIALWQSKLTVKPKVGGVDLESVLKYYEQLDRNGVTPIKYVRAQGTRMVEVNLADLHLSKLCWHGETPENYDHKIAQDVFYRIIGEIAQHISASNVPRVEGCWT